MASLSATTSITLLVISLLGAGVRGAVIDHSRLPPPASRRIDFRRDVYPLLSRRCFQCHRGSNPVPRPATRSASHAGTAREPSSGVRLDVRAVILGESNGRALAAPGKSEESRLIQLVAGVGEQRMPPVGSGAALTGAEIGILRAWIDQGLGWDEGLLPAPGRRVEHWAFRPVRRPVVPQVRRTAWVRTPIDAFIGAEQERRGLVSAPEASRRVLMRRVTLDLTGLPPTPEEIQVFLADPAPDAYEKLVERLLASLHYGERWGRHWLDVARWAESEGYENNEFRPAAWRYRDYVVRSFQQDKPFHRFIREQIAGDELLPYSDENLIATGFLAAARYSGNEEDKAMQRNDVLVDIANATASAFLGLTVACAQCHDHKWDPISQRDYYRLQGFFVRGQVNNLLLKDPALWKEYEARIPPEYRPALKERDEFVETVRKRLVETARAKLSAEMRAALETPEDRRTPEQQELVRQGEKSLQFGQGEVEKAFTDEERKRYDGLKASVEELEKKVPLKPQTVGFYSPATSPTLVEVVQMKANFPLPYNPEELKKTKPCLLIRGNVHQRGPESGAGWPGLFGDTPRVFADTGSRTALAAWLASPSNPLTARVWANRVWHHHFGRGIVPTPGDFGLRGERPTHPALLDFLASEFVRGGWSTKHLHRIIVNSATYRQASRPHPANARKDPENRYCWRWTPRRLEAEAIRDSLLAVSGELDRSMGGPSVPLKERKNYYLMEPPEETGSVLRRTLYLRQFRDTLPPTQALFDAPNASESCPRRYTSTVPLQPLFLLNSPFVMDRAKAFAKRVAAVSGNDPKRQVNSAFLLALGRYPGEEERRAMLGLMRPAAANEDPATSLLHVCHLLFNLSEFSYLE